MLIFGIGLGYSTAVCTAAIYICIFFYSSSKFFVYAFLCEFCLRQPCTAHLYIFFIAEKVYIVWSRANGVRRFESPVYLACAVSVSFYCIVMTLMLGGAPFHSLALCRAKLYVGPIHEFAPNGSCTIGLKPFGYIPLLAYDMCVYWIYYAMREELITRALQVYQHFPYDHVLDPAVQNWKDPTQV